MRWVELPGDISKWTTHWT